MFQEDESEWTLESASEFGLVRLLDRLLKHEYSGFSQQFREKRLRAAVKRGYDIPVLQWWLKLYMPGQTKFSKIAICGIAIRNAQLHVLQWLLHEGQLPNIRFGTTTSPEIAYWLYDHGRQLPTTVMVPSWLRDDPWSNVTPTCLTTAADIIKCIHWCLKVENDEDYPFIVKELGFSLLPNVNGMCFSFL